MVYLLNYKSLHKAPPRTPIRCLEERQDKKFDYFSPLTPSPFVRSLIHQRRYTQAKKEMISLSRSEKAKSSINALKHSTQDVILVTHESDVSPLTELRKELLKKWGIDFTIVS